MIGTNLARMLGAAFVTSAALLSAPVPFASAQPPPPAPGCPDVEVVFARGTSEPPGVGGVGQAFVDSVRAQAGPKSVNVYPVNYLASSDFGNRIEFARTVVDGVRDAGLHVEATAANCPNTKIVLGGFSQAQRWRAMSPRLRYPRESPLNIENSFPIPCHRRWLTMSPRWS